MSEEQKTDMVQTEQETKEKSGTSKKSGGKKWGIVGGIIVILLAIIIGISIYNSPSNRLSRQLNLGQRCLEEQNYEQAIVEFDKAIAIDPMSVEAYLGKAQAYEGLGDIDMVLQTLEEGYKLTNDERLLEVIEKSSVFDITNNANSFVQERDDVEENSSDIQNGNMENAVLLSEEPHSYVAYFDSSFVDRGDYYEVTGKVVDMVKIPENIVESMSAGDHYSYDNFNFIYEQKVMSENSNFVYYTFTDSNDNQYVVDTHSSITSNGERYYDMRDIREYTVDGRPISPGGGFYVLVDDSYVFYISKQQYVSICTNVEETGHGGFSYSYESFKLEDIVEKDIRDINGNLFTQAIGLPVRIHVDTEGKISSYSLDNGELFGNYIDTTGAIKELSEISQ